MIRESESVRPPPTTWMAAAISSGPSRRNTNQATTAICPANIAAKISSPHTAVPQNFQMRGGLWEGMTAADADAISELRVSINWLLTGGKFRASRQCPVQQPSYI